jgi:4-carboxymuconolactone decarboxylase
MNEYTCTFPIGEENVKYAKYFTGKSFISDLSSDSSQVVIDNVTFEPGCRNAWHIHNGAQQILICVGGEGWYQEEGKEAIKMKPGDIIEIPLGVKHWHGATKDSWFSHLSVLSRSEMVNGSTEWKEPVSDEDYSKL